MTLTVKNATDETKNLEADGTGTIGDPFVMAHVLRVGTVTIGKLGANPGVNIGSVTATIANAIPAGTQTIGKLAANSGVNIGDVHTVDHVTDCEKIAGLGKGQGTMANSFPVTIASNQSAFAVKGSAIRVPVTLTVTDDVYTIGMSAGGRITFANAVSANGKSSKVKSLTLCGCDSPLEYQLVFYGGEAWNDHEFLVQPTYIGFCGSIPIAAADYVQEISGLYMATIRDIGLQVQSAATTIYGILIAKEVTSPGTTSLYIAVDFEYVD